MNYALAREIYGHNVWMVDRFTFNTLQNMLTDFRNGVVSEIKEADRLNATALYGINSGTRVVTPANDSTGVSEQLVSITKINGPIVKNGGMSSYGMQEIGNSLMKYDKNPNVIGHVLLIDSGGGSSSGKEVMEYAIDQLKKPSASVVERGGVAASAAYGIAAHTGRIFAESKSSVVGSIGSMISFKAQPNKTVDANGEKQVTIYATNSTKKNLWFEEALNNDNYQLAIDEMLDPHETAFRQDIRAKRPNAEDSHVNGSVYNAGDVVGVLVDAIGGQQDAINWIKLQHSQGKLNSNSLNQNNTAMTTAELKAQHPNTYNEILGIGMAAGVAAEKDRTGSWMAHISTDPETVKKGIEAGGEISATVRENLLVKANANAKLGALQNDSAKNVITPEATTEAEKAEKTEAKEFYDGIMAKLITK